MDIYEESWNKLKNFHPEYTEFHGGGKGWIFNLLRRQMMVSGIFPKVTPCRSYLNKRFRKKYKNTRKA